MKKKLDAFQLKGLRQVLKMQTTYMNRTNTNRAVFLRANQIINNYDNRHIQDDRFRQRKQIIPISEFYEIQRRKLIISIINAPADNPVRQVCADDALRLIEYGVRRVGRPRHNWWIHGLQQYWKYATEHYAPALVHTTFNIDNQEHTHFLVQAASQNWGNSI